MNSCEAIIEAALREGRRSLLPHEALALVECWGLPVARYRLARSPTEAREAARELSGKVALKIVSPDVLHKSDVGGVMLNITLDSVEEAYRVLVDRVSGVKPGARILGVLVQEMVEEGVEVIVGGLRDETFGPVVALGLGGVLTELYEDVAFRATPVTRLDFEDMLRQLRASKLLAGYRGKPPRDLDALYEIVKRVGEMLEKEPICELDLNPVIVYEAGRGAKIVDARIVLEGCTSPAG